MIDKATFTASQPTLSPLARAVLDAVTEGVAVFDAQGRLLYANASARRLVAGPNGDMRRHLQHMGAQFTPLRNGTQTLGEAAILPASGAPQLTLADRERLAIAETLQGTSGRLAETARRLGISRTTLWRRLKAYGLDGFRPTP
ncbi:MAG: helix-turn-helix domain-containing protein [Gemmatimonadales bacterium]